jgi:hypothetical protein
MKDAPIGALERHMTGPIGSEKEAQHVTVKTEKQL